MAGDLRDVLLAIRTKHGRLTPQLVVDEARDENSPLHSRFEWRDDIAAEKYRRHQAHELIQRYRIRYREADETHPAGYVRAFHAVPTENGVVYEPAEEIADNPLTRKLVLQAMEREWKALHRRYQHFTEFTEIVRRDLQEGAA